MASDSTYRMRAIRSFPLSSAEWETVSKALGLSPQQARIVKWIMHGLPDKQIAEEMGLRVPTVRTYLERIFARMSVEDRVGLILYVFGVSHRIHCRRCPQSQ